MKVKIHPGFPAEKQVSGIDTVIRKQYEHLPKYGVEIVEEERDADLLVVHAGLLQVNPNIPTVAQCHGAYWESDYEVTRGAHIANARVMQNILFSKRFSVPSEWVAKTFRRDLLVDPDIIPHGIDWQEWDHNKEHQGYVLWAKNRVYDACSPEAVNKLAALSPDTPFITTFGTPTHNVKVVGVMPGEVFKPTLQEAMCIFSTAKETFGIWLLEAQAAGIPVLGWDYGGNSDLVIHGQTGYLAPFGDYDALLEGLRYIEQYRGVLSDNARRWARQFTWERAMEKTVSFFRAALEDETREPRWGVVIPYYNKEPSILHRAIESVVSQEYEPVEIVVVDDGSTDPTAAESIVDSFPAVTLIRQENSGVAVARNTGAWSMADKGIDYLTFLDADDQLHPEFGSTCVETLEANHSLHLAYTRIRAVFPDGYSEVSKWPGEWSFDEQLQKRNQVPTANMMRYQTFLQLGGYRSQYAPRGAGTEDAELWLRFGEYGKRCELVTDRPLFIYSMHTGVTSQQGYNEVLWIDKPWCTDPGKHLIGSYATPGNKIAHPARTYDSPTVAVVIPIGPKHVEHVHRAIQSVMEQSYTSWELILVNDTGSPLADHRFKTPYPFATILNTEGAQGPGKARNMALEVTRAPLTLYLDADDNLTNEALTIMVSAWSRTRDVIYSGYYTVSTPDDPDALLEQVEKDPWREFEAYNEDKGLFATLTHPGAYNCELAQRQPVRGDIPYLWCTVSCLYPTQWIRDIGGFDEQMRTWEDVDLVWRLARAGRCFTPVDAPALVYRMYSGGRRMAASSETDEGRQLARQMLQYLDGKRNADQLEGRIMPCNCRGKKTTAVSSFVQGQDGNLSGTDEELVEAVFYPTDGSTGGYRTPIGPQTKTKYRRSQPGDTIFVKKADIHTDRLGNWLKPFLQPKKEDVPPPVTRREPVSPQRMEFKEAPVLAPVDEELEVLRSVQGTTSVKQVAGVGPKRAQALREAGVGTAEKLAASSPERIARVCDIAVSVAERLIEGATLITSD